MAAPEIGVERADANGEGVCGSAPVLPLNESEGGLLHGSCMQPQPVCRDLRCPTREMHGNDGKTLLTQALPCRIRHST